jgi:hypothetical protein
MKPKWLDRRLVLSPVYYTVCTSQKMFESLLREKKIETFEGVNLGKGASTHFLKNDRNESVAIVCLYDHKHLKEQVYALLAHEAIHVWQEVLEVMGEKGPSPEFEAYSIQQICQELFLEYKRQTARHK